MKKIIAAAAGLMLVGTVASAAVADEAGVSFQGDARARFYYQDDYNFVDEKDTHWNSRVRLQWKAKTAGGAYAIGRFRLGDATWDGTQQTGAFGESSNLKVDKAYIGVPFGPVTVEAGMMYRTLTAFLEMDVLVDAVQAKYQADNTDLVAFYEKQDEVNDTTDADGNVVAEPDSEDDDVDRYGARLIQKFEGGWSLTAAAVVVDDQQADADGIAGTIGVNGAFGGVTVGAELAYKEADLQGTVDDGLGGWASATMPLGAADVTVIAGFTADGFEADGDFGPFIMLSDASQIATGKKIGDGGDTFFAGVKPTFQASEKLTFGALLAYADIDSDVVGTDSVTAWEVGGTASYAVTDGASLNAVIGYLDVDNALENPFGFGLSLEIAY